MTAISPLSNSINSLFDNPYRTGDNPFAHLQAPKAEPRALPAQAKNDRADELSSSRFIQRYQATQAAFSRNETVDIQLQTQEGDVITISLNIAASANYNLQSQSVRSGQNILASRYESLSLSSSSNLAITINGDLDQDELDALDELLSQVNTIADTFFNGDREGALAEALQLTFDSNEIAAVAVDLGLQQSQSIVQYYEQVHALGDGNKPFGQAKYSALDQLLAPLYERTADINDSGNTNFIEDLLATLLAAKDHVSKNVASKDLASKDNS